MNTSGEQCALPTAPSPGEQYGVPPAVTISPVSLDSNARWAERVRQEEKFGAFINVAPQAFDFDNPADTAKARSVAHGVSLVMQSGIGFFECPIPSGPIIRNTSQDGNPLGARLKVSVPRRIGTRPDQYADYVISSTDTLLSRLRSPYRLDTSEPFEVPDTDVATRITVLPDEDRAIAQEDIVRLPDAPAQPDIFDHYCTFEGADAPVACQAVAMLMKGIAQSRNLKIRINQHSGEGMAAITLSSPEGIRTGFIAVTAPELLQLTVAALHQADSPFEFERPEVVAAEAPGYENRPHMVE